MKFTQRDIPPRSLWALEQAGVHPLLARLFAARGVHGPQDLDPDLAHLLPLQNLKGVQEAAVLLADAIARQECNEGWLVGLLEPLLPFQLTRVPQRAI